MIRAHTRMGFCAQSILRNYETPPSQPPVNVPRTSPDRRLLLDHMMVWREMTDRIGGAGVAGEGEGLAAAAAEIDLTALAAPARLGQEIGPAEGIEGGVVLPNLAQRMVFHRPEFETRDRFRRMARQHAAGRRHVQRAAAQP